LLAFTFAPAALRIQKQTTSKSDSRGFKIDSGEGRIHGHLKLKGVNANILDLKVSGKDTNGGLASFNH